MMVVRFPTGFSVQYNDATWLDYHNGVVWELRTREGGRWIASISPQSGAIVEAVKPCKMDNPVMGLTNESAIKRVMDNMRQMTDWRETSLLADLKRALRDFNAGRRRWK